jgi:hypothetical protein
MVNKGNPVLHECLIVEIFKETQAKMEIFYPKHKLCYGYLEIQTLPHKLVSYFN